MFVPLGAQSGGVFSGDCVTDYNQTWNYSSYLLFGNTFRNLLQTGQVFSAGGIRCQVAEWLAAGNRVVDLNDGR